eukprot:5141110-Ditylum_brightwellii.AAC.1
MGKSSSISSKSKHTGKKEDTISSSSSSFSCTERAKYLLRRIERGYVDGDDNDNDCYDGSKYNNSRTSSSISVPSPDQFSYNTVIAALANESFMQEAASNWHQKQQQKHKNQYQSRKDIQTKENAITDDTTERAEALLGRMRICGIEPDVVNAVISAWSSSGEGEESACQAECILASIEENQGKIHQHQYV